MHHSRLVTALEETSSNTEIIADLADSRRHSKGGSAFKMNVALLRQEQLLNILGLEHARERSRWFNLAQAVGPCSWPGFGKGEDLRWVVVGAILFVAVAFGLSLFLQVIVQQSP